MNKNVVDYIIDSLSFFSEETNEESAMVNDLNESILLLYKNQKYLIQITNLEDINEELDKMQQMQNIINGD